MSYIFQTADEYEFKGIVYDHAHSPIATKHCLVSVACQSSTLRLVDLKSGSATHTLKGHRSPVICTSWSTKEEFILASGRFVLVWVLLLHVLCFVLDNIFTIIIMSHILGFIFVNCCLPKQISIFQCHID